MPAHPSPSLRVTSGEIHLWYMALDGSLGADLLGRYEALLQPDERQRLGALALERRRREYLATRALVRCVLSRYYPTAPADWRFRITARGQPVLDPPRELHFNLTNCAGAIGGAKDRERGRGARPAHGASEGARAAVAVPGLEEGGDRPRSSEGEHQGPPDGFVACAIAPCHVGIDAEPCSRAPTVLGLVARFLTEGEREELSRLDAGAQADRVMSLWTLKEAYVKARGLGLALPLHSFAFAFEPGRVTLAAAPPCDASSWEFAIADVLRHRVALAAERSTGEPRVLRAFEMTPLAGEPREVAPCVTAPFHDHDAGIHDARPTRT